MKTILYMAQSLNGYIAKGNGDTAWIGSSDKAMFKEMTTKASNVVMGRNTYDIMQTEGAFPLPGRLNVVMTREARPSEANVLFTGMPPAEVLDYLRKQGYVETMVVGGGKIAKSFLEENLIDELYVTIEPIILGRGVSFLERDGFIEEGDLEITLELLETIKLSDSEVQLHYKVCKQKVLVADNGEENINSYGPI
jgi:dihydrofolate reductase